MAKQLLFSEAEVAEPVDFSNIGLYAREGIENLNSGAIGYPRHWAEFTVSTPTATTIRVAPGRLFRSDAVFDLDAPIDLSMTPQLPLVVGDQRYIAILARGLTETENASRLIETNADTGATVSVSAPKTNVRKVDLVIQQGVASPTPLRPTVANNECCICFVLLGSTGIILIESAQDFRVKTLYEVEGRVTVLEGQMVIAFQSVKTLQTDLAALEARLSRIPRPEVISQLQRDAARTRRLLGLPDEARAYFYDPGLVKDQWETTHPNWLARVREGVRFAFAAERDDRLELINEADPNIRITDEILLPHWTEIERIVVQGAGSFKNISQQVHTVTTAIERSVSRSSIEYGPTIAICENNAEWDQVGAARIGEQFQVAGETFQSLGVINSNTPQVDLSVIQTWNPTVTQAGIVDWNTLPQAAGHLNYAVQQVNYSSWTETYWDYVTETFGVNGSVYAQTWLNAQGMILTSIDLNFTRVDSTGDVHLSLCETGPTGAPNFDRVIARVTRVANTLALGWQKFTFTPRYLQPGRRYAWVTVTTGNHALATVTGSQFTQGTLFWSTDSAWFQGAPEEDFAFRVNSAQFARNRTTVEFEPLTLENGMTQIHLLYPDWVPPGCNIVWEVQPSGSTDWYLLQFSESSPLNGLPALVRLRATFIGTPDIAPAMELSSKARGRSQRHRTDMTAVTKQMNFGFNTTSILVETVVDAWQPAHNTIENRLIIGVTTYTPSITTTEADITRPGRYTVTSQFTVPSTNNARIRVNLGTNSSLRIPFIQNISLYAL
jgi:hypothetical protein